jgi:hypothetical protein
MDQLQPFEPHVFKDGRAGKYWIALVGETDGPFNTREDAQATLDRLNADPNQTAKPSVDTRPPDISPSSKRRRRD